MSRWALASVALTIACGSRSGLTLPTASDAGSSGAGGTSLGGQGGASGGAAGGSAGSGASASACYSEVISGGSHTCARTAGGQVYCFGANQFGQVGKGLPGDDVPVPTLVAGPTDFVALGAGEFHSSGVRAGGSAMGWGHNPLGVLGDGTTTDQPLPVAVVGLGDAVEISHGMVAGHACARHANGDVSCWGQNDHGEVGSASLASSLVPKKVKGGGNAVSIAVGYLLSCAARENGRVRCWGWNASGALGIGVAQTGIYPTPQAVLGVTDAVQVVAGNHYACARLASGAVWCWGYNGSGQLGSGTDVESVTQAQPVVGLSDATWLSGGQSHVCAVRASGEVACWGRNYFGQLGDGTTEDRNAPVKVLSVAQATRVSAGGEHTCALSQTQGLVCWGANESGQLGDGTKDESLQVREVLCP